MKALITILTVLFLCIPNILVAEEEESTFMVLAWDFSDRQLSTMKGDSCAQFLTYLKNSTERYKLVSVTGVVGPPGVVYTLENNRQKFVILKCGTVGGHGDGGSGGHD